MKTTKSIRKYFKISICILTTALVTFIASMVMLTNPSYADDGLEITKINGETVTASQTEVNIYVVLNETMEPVQLEASGENLTWNVDKLDNYGMQINSSTGIITGVPNQEGTIYIRATVSDNYGRTDNIRLNIVVYDRERTPYVYWKATDVKDGMVGKSYYSDISVYGYTEFDFEIKSGSLPDGLSFINKAGGYGIGIGGTPTKAGTYTFELVFNVKNLLVSEPYEFTITIGGGPIQRIYGQTRYTTAFKNADKLKELQGGKNFDTVVVTTGEKAPDALSGSYLASKNDAPLLLINRTSASSVREYIKNNLNPGGRIIILGGTNSVQDSWLSDVGEYTIDRIAGSTRYETNLKILEEVGYTSITSLK